MKESLIFDPQISFFLIFNQTTTMKATVTPYAGISFFLIFNQTTT